MADAKRCDICGVSYDASATMDDGTISIFSYNDIHEVYSGCPVCMKAIYDFIEGRKPKPQVDESTPVDKKCSYCRFFKLPMSDNPCCFCDEDHNKFERKEAQSCNT